MATAYLMEQIIKMTDATCDQEHIEIIIYNIPTIPDRTSYIIGKSTDSPLLKMQNVAYDLQKSACEILAMPCITAHYFHDELQSAVDIPIIHGIKETGIYLKNHGIDSVGIMATDGTVSSNLFGNCLEEFGINVIYPEENMQKYVMNLIYDNVKAGASIDMNKFEKVSEHLFSKGAKVILLGCTELSIIKRDLAIGSGYLDVIDVIAQSAVKACGNLKKEYEEIIT